MKFLVTFLAVLSVSLAIKVHEDQKDKRDAPDTYQTQYPSTSYQGPSSNYQSSASHYPTQSFGHDDNAVSIGAGYSIGAKPSFDLGSSGYQVAPEGLPSSGHANIQLAPITFQPSQSIGSHDLNDLMNQISQGLNSGSISLSSLQGHEQGGQDLGQFSFGSHNLQFAEQSSVPAYAAGTKGLGSYGSTGPVLFNPGESHSAAQSTLSFAAPVSAGHSFGDANTLSLSDAGHSFAGLTLSPAHGLGGHELSFASGGHGHSLAGLSLNGGSVHPLGGSISFAGSEHSFGSPLKAVGGHSGKPSFKPSAYLGTAGHGDSHGHSASSGSYAPSFGSHSLSGGHSLGGHSLSGSQGLTGGHSFTGGHGLSLQGLSGGHGHSFGSGHGASNSGHGLSGSAHGLSGSSHGLPSSGHGFSGATHGLSSSGHGQSSSSHNSFPSFPSFSGSAPKLSHFSHKPEGYMSLEGISAHLSSQGIGHGHGLTASHAASSHTPQYHVSPSKYNKFSEGGSYKGHGHGYSPKHYRSAPSSRHAAPKDSHGAYSETVYNTIKYSEELKPRTH